jgi:hypothetical protein
MTNQGMGDIRSYLTSKSEYLRGNWDLYMAFLILALDNAKIVAFITPDKWLSKPFGMAFRGYYMRDRLSKISHAGAKVFRDATVDAIVTLFTQQAQSLDVARINNDKSITKVTTTTIKSMEEPYLIDYLFSGEASFVMAIDKLPTKLSDLGVSCENACATSDAYKLSPLVFNNESFNGVSEYKLVNTGTIVKYGTAWGEKNITYLGRKMLFPVVNISDFEKNLGRTYVRRTKNKKIIFKGLNLLDAYLDLEGYFIPGKTTLVVCSESEDLLKILCALINSSLVYKYLKIKYNSSSYCGGLTFTPDMINYIPIPIFTDEEKKKILRLVNHILTSEKPSNQDIADIDKEISSCYLRSTL